MPRWPQPRISSLRSVRNSCKSSRRSAMVPPGVTYSNAPTVPLLWTNYGHRDRQDSKKNGAKLHCSSRLLCICLIDQPPTHNGSDNFCRADRIRFYVKDVLRQDDDVGELADLDRTFRFFAVAGKRRSERITLNRLRHGQSLLGDKAPFRFTFRRLSRNCALNPLPRIERNDGPIAAEGQAASSIRDAFPGPGARSAIGAGIARPDVQRVGIRVRMERLHAGDDPEFAESRNVGRG